MNKNWIDTFNDYVFLREKNIDQLTFSNEDEKYTLAFHSRISSISNEIIFLLNHEKYAGVQILMRSVMETFADLRCLVSHSDYLNVIDQDIIKAEKQKLVNYEANNPYQTKYSEAEAQEKLEHLKSKENKKYIWSFEKKFRKAEMEPAYRTIYANLCEHTHGNPLILGSTVFDDDKIVYNKKPNDKTLEYILSSSVNVAVAACIEVCVFYKMPLARIAEFEELIYA
jgi:hypothetical protein